MNVGKEHVSQSGLWVQVIVTLLIIANTHLVCERSVRPQPAVDCICHGGCGLMMKRKLRRVCGRWSRLSTRLR